jgi:hypothetical protein
MQKSGGLIVYEPLHIVILPPAAGEEAFVAHSGGVRVVSAFDQVGFSLQLLPMQK